LLKFVICGTSNCIGVKKALAGVYVEGVFREI